MPISGVVITEIIAMVLVMRGKLAFDNPEPSIGAITTSQSASFALSKAGFWGYHNHLDSNQTGTIDVQ